MGRQDLPGRAAQQAAEPGVIQLADDFRGSGPPLVFVHGLTFDRTSWQPIIDRLAGAYRCTAANWLGTPMRMPPQLRCLNHTGAPGKGPES
jgi:pimeloyl-ACP methyl ester carboxylesterase